MEHKEKLLRPKGNISRGVLLPHLKKTAEYETVVLKDVAEVRIPLSQHIGTPAEPIVKKGDKVFVGTLIARANGYVSAGVHSSVSGTVKGIEENANNGKCILIESDGAYETEPSLKTREVKTAKDLSLAAAECGLVGLGGAGFPTSVKLDVKDKQIDTLIINAAECEPYITVDYSECMDNFDDVLKGVTLVKNILKIPEAIICVESNKQKAIEKLLETVADDTIKIMMLPTKYPQGAEKMLIYSATGKKVPLGKLPSDVGCIVMNVTSVATLYRFITTGMPLVSKRLTVDGTAVAEPKNVIVPIGTPIKDLLEFVGVEGEVGLEIMMGGPMMGVAVADINSVIEKRNNAITVLKTEDKQAEGTHCIRCGRCANVCPMQIFPLEIERAVKNGRNEKLKELNVEYCIECGCCSFVCPAKIPLTADMRVAKQILRRETAK